MKRWKVILQSNSFFLLLVLFVIIFLLISFLIPEKSKYHLEDEEIVGQVLDYKINGNQLSFTIKGKEKVMAFYTIKSEEEKAILENTFGYGLTLKIKGQMSEAEENKIPNTFNYQKYLYYNHIFYTFQVSSYEITSEPHGLNKIKNMITKYIKKQTNSEYLQAFLLGNTKTFDLTNIRKNGVSHLFAVSGMHISLFVLVLSKLLKKVKGGKVAISIFLFFYSFLVGFTPSVMRVVLSYHLTILNKMVGKPLSNKKILFFCFLIMILYDPFYIMNMAFLYSFFISFCLLFMSEEKNYFKGLLKTSFIAFLASMPITAMNFYQVNFLSILLNLVFVPLVSLVIYPMCFIVLIAPFLHPLFSIILSFFEILSAWCATLTFGLITIPKVSFLWWVLYLLVFILYLQKKHKKYLLLLGCITSFLMILPKFNGSSFVYFIDVGQGDSTLFISSHQKDVILIDTGGKINYQTEEWMKKTNSQDDVETIVTFIHSLGISSIDSLVLTHGDYDHMGESINLVNNFKVDKVLFNCGPYNDLENELIEILEKKKIEHDSCIKDLNIDNNKLYFLNTKDYDNENDNSSVIYTELNNYKFLFMGDASITTEKEILNNYDLLNIDVLKVGHHGSKTSSSKKFINEINPKYSIISVGKNNRYGHPNKEVLDNLQNSKIYRTDLDGSIMFKIKKDKLEIKTWAP